MVHVGAVSTRHCLRAPSPPPTDAANVLSSVCLSSNNFNVNNALAIYELILIDVSYLLIDNVV